MKKEYLLALLCLCFKYGQAQTFNDGTLSYIVIDSENKYVSVEKYNSCPTGALIIPETVNIEDIIYTITSI
ncbi:hypothetical protein, partial [Flavicella sp.]|uniref:hypothetical protein n=1 Tax=Flavicella sp. TaxID=2957742 RepID=UPI00301B098B